jgi:hypothetical protein
VRRFLLLALAGAFLFLALVAGEYLLLPAGWEILGRGLYRLAFLLVLPARLVCLPILGLAAHRADWIYWAGVSLVAPFAYAWAVRLLLHSPPRPADDEVSLGRRSFLFRGALGAAALPAAGFGGYASLVAPQRLRLREERIALAGLPPALEGFRIAHVSDTHYGPFVSLPFLEGVVAQVNDLRADLLLLTGDYVHRTPRAIPGGIAVLGRMRARLGAVAVLGNHDHWEGADAVRDALRREGIELVENRCLYVDRNGLSASPKGLCIAGVGDLWDGVVDPRAALSSVPPGTPRILLSHNPDVAEMIPEGTRVDLMMSGHTHGGQIRLPILGAPGTPSRHGEKYLGGLCAGPRCPVLVSRGVGITGIPVRFGVPPEIGLVTLTSKA